MKEGKLSVLRMTSESTSSSILQFGAEQRPIVWPAWKFLSITPDAATLLKWSQR